MCRKRNNRPHVRTRVQTQEGYRKRGDTDVLQQAEGPGALHAQEQEAVEAGGDPLRDRLHLRPPERTRNPSRRQRVRRHRRPEPEEEPVGRLTQTTVGCQAEPQHHPVALRGAHTPKRHGKLRS